MMWNAKKYTFIERYRKISYGPFYANRVEQAWNIFSERQFGSNELKWKEAKKGWEFKKEK